MPVRALAHTVKSKVLSALAFTTKSSIDAPDAALLALFGVTPSISGASVTPQSAMGVPAVAAAVTLISDAVGTLPAKLFTSLGDGGKETDTKHPSYVLVHDDANEWTSASQLRGQLTADALLYGNGYAFANRVNGKVVELLRLNPETVKPHVHKTTGEPSFIVKEGSKTRTYPFQDILHIPAFTGSDGITGIAPIDLQQLCPGALLHRQLYAIAHLAFPVAALVLLSPHPVRRLGRHWQGRGLPTLLLQRSHTAGSCALMWVRLYRDELLP